LDGWENQEPSQIVEEMSKNCPTRAKNSKNK